MFIISIILIILLILILLFGLNNITKLNEGFRNTRNMSYDLRGDPLIIPKSNINPFNNSSIINMPYKNIFL